MHQEQDVLKVYDKRSNSAMHFEGLSGDFFDNWDLVDGKEENAGSDIGMPPSSISSRGYWVDGIKLKDKTAWTTNACQTCVQEMDIGMTANWAQKIWIRKKRIQIKSQHLSIQDSKDCTRKKMMMPSFPH
jgi:hypothetical protein